MKNISDILIKPIITEKSNALSEKLNQFSFMVGWKANKNEIKNAIKEMYGIDVVSVSTARIPAKARIKYTAKGISKGKKAAYKKAIITCKEGETIDFYNSI